MGQFQPGQSGNPDKKFKPGQSGNPKGRPKAPQLSAIMAERLMKRELAGKKIPNRKTVAEHIVNVVLTKAANGDIRFIRLIWDRIEGKVPVPIVGPDGGPVANVTVSATPPPEYMAQVVDLMTRLQPNGAPGGDGDQSGDGDAEPA